MNCKKIFIAKERRVFIDTYIIEDSKNFQHNLIRPVVIICPGGGYRYLSDRESMPIALQFVAAGFHTIVLHYGVNEFAPMPGPLKDLADTVSYVRRHCREWHVNPDQIYVCGFSAGAHVAASLGVFWNNALQLPDYADCPELIRPNGMILGYPVLDLASSSNHLDIGTTPDMKISDIKYEMIHPNMPLEQIFIMDKREKRYFVNFEAAMNAYIFGGPYTKEMEKFYSLQNQVSIDTPPTFIWHTAQDQLIFPSNAIKFVTALEKFHIPYELHIFGDGGHGLALGNYMTAHDETQVVDAIQPWKDLALSWLHRQTGFKKAFE